MTINKDYDAIIIGSGMGGMTVAALLANDGYRVLILEAALHPGGCSSSYPRKGYIFESGATTLIGFDEYQPLRYLEEQTGIHIPRVELNPSMKVWLDGEPITRFKNRAEWIEEAARVFGNRKGQTKFWELAFNISDVVWKVSLQNSFFPPLHFSEWWELATSNNPKDVWVLPYAKRSVKSVARKCGVDSARFLRFLDEQLMITAQSKSEETPFLFGAPGITYTNYSNYYVPGGLIKMIHAIQNFIQDKNGSLFTKEGVNAVEKKDGEYLVYTKKQKVYQAPIVVSNIPIWNMDEIVDPEMKPYFRKQAQGFEKAWSALTMGIATSDSFPENLGLHHQIHLDGERVPFTDSESIFVSMSKRGDLTRAPEGQRTLNISCHADPESWFSVRDDYEMMKKKVHSFIVSTLNKKLPGFAHSKIEIADLATPVSWEKWVYRKKGRVGGIPQSMARSLLNWTPNKTPYKGFYLVGDTTYPGQGIPGVTLSGINVYSRIKKDYIKKPIQLESVSA
ncbi:MAG: NAD(P)/FAD-dependent oxidoreductase [Balneolales bacterium]|nr:NAD(P)/FAD-dependent oxidoreductase [Balneolales bacterium]